MEDKEKYDPGEVHIEKGKFLLWLENYWYHYKWHTIVIGFFLIVSLISFVQCAKKDKEDMVIYYGGNVTLSVEEANNVKSILELVMGNDTTIALNSLSIYSEDELIKENTYYDEARTTNALDTYTYAMSLNKNQSNFSTLKSYYMAGESAVFLVSPYVYKEEHLSELCTPLSEIFESVPSSAYDTYAITLGNTELYQKYKALQVLPADTLVILQQPIIYGSTRNEETYQLFKSLFVNIVEFKKS